MDDTPALGLEETPDSPKEPQLRQHKTVSCEPVPDDIG